MEQGRDAARRRGEGGSMRGNCPAGEQRWIRLGWLFLALAIAAASAVSPASLSAQSSAPAGAPSPIAAPGESPIVPAPAGTEARVRSVEPPRRGDASCTSCVAEGEGLGGRLREGLQHGRQEDVREGRARLHASGARARAQRRVAPGAVAPPVTDEGVPAAIEGACTERRPPPARSRFARPSRTRRSARSSRCSRTSASSSRCAMVPPKHSRPGRNFPVQEARRRPARGPRPP